MRRVEVENMHRNLAMKKSLVKAILDGASQIAVPALVSTLSICVVFVPVLLLTGAAKFLFTPLAGAVVFAMLTSYLLSRTLIPSMAHYLLGDEAKQYQQSGKLGGGEPGGGGSGQKKGWLLRLHDAFDRRFEAGRERYKGVLDWALDHRPWVASLFGVFIVLSLGLVFLIGRDFFPYVDSGQMRLHVRAPEGTRIEETEQIFARIEAEIRGHIPGDEIDTIIDNIGVPIGGINLAFGDSATIGSADGDILIALKEKHGPSRDYERDLRESLGRTFPRETFFFQAANITNQILNFGLQAPIDVQVLGRSRDQNLEIARKILADVKAIPGAVDVHLGQEVDAPTVQVDVDRDKAQQAGLTQRDVANSTLISLASSGQVAPTQWLNPNNGVSYQIQVQTPQSRIDSFDALNRTPVTGSATPNAQTQLLGNLSTLHRTSSTALVSHYDVQPVFDIFASTDERDLGGVAARIDEVVKKYEKDMPQGTTIKVRGQVDTMRTSFTRLEIGLVFAVLFVYLLLVVNFQSWLDPVIILMAVPGTFAGVLWMLYLTGTTFNVPSMMGAIMAIGVATSNSILLVVFANDERKGMDGAAPKDARAAALSAGYTRMRPVLMTALAMIIGMLPMALSLGEGGEQNAPLGRAVIGGMLVSTLSTLFLVPIVYAWFSKEAPRDRDQQIEDEYHEGDDKASDKKSGDKGGGGKPRPPEPSDDGRSGGMQPQPA